MTMDDYLAYGGDYYIKILAGAAGVPTSSVTITKVGVGSVIINYVIKSSGGSLAEQKEELEKIKAQLDEATKSGTMNAFGGAKLLNYESGVVVISKGFAYVNNCLIYKKAEEDESEDEDKKSKHLGAILGGVLGGTALIVAIGLLIGYAYKKGFFKKS